MKTVRLFFIFSLLLLFGFTWPIASLFSGPETIQTELPSKIVKTSNWLQTEFNRIKTQASNIDDKVLRLSLLAYQNAMKKGLPTKPLLTVIDYSKPSTEKRLWVFDLKNGKTLFNTWVSHGKNSGGISPTSFSNRSGSLKSSFGVFITEHPYMGGNGYSLRLKGLERGINDNAYNRNVVVHGARYVNPEVIKSYGRIGRSWGCPAVSLNLIKPLINTIKDQTIFFVYYPDRNWLSHSQFLASR
jgi:hypothetical protein